MTRHSYRTMIHDASHIAAILSGVDAVEEFRYLVLAAQREGNRTFTEVLRRLELTPSQAEALSVLRGARRALSVREVGERLVCERGSPSRLTSTLVKKGLVASEADVSDARATRLYLTAAGKRAAKQVAAAEQRLYQALAPALDPQALAAANDLLRALVAERPAGRALARRIAEERAG
jgi:MarR family transcriptional regulator, organic hydroperoxide resistance regulator